MANDLAYKLAKQQARYRAVIGAMVALVMVAQFLWIGSLNATVREQAAALNETAAALDQSRGELLALRGDASETNNTLNSLNKSIKVLSQHQAREDGRSFDPAGPPPGPTPQPSSTQTPSPSPTPTNTPCGADCSPPARCVETRVTSVCVKKPNLPITAAAALGGGVFGFVLLYRKEK